MSRKVPNKESKYEGRYVAMESFAKSKVISYGKNPAAVVNKARGKGIDSPVVIFVPKHGEACLY